MADSFFERLRFLGTNNDSRFRRPPHMLLGAVAIGHDRLQPFAIPRSEPAP